MGICVAEAHSVFVDSYVVCRNAVEFGIISKFGSSVGIRLGFVQE